jgi:Integrase core domain
VALSYGRMGHPSDRVLSKIIYLSNLNSNCCEVCNFAKQTKLPFSLSNNKTNKPFQLIHSDVWGPAPIDSYDNFKYFVTFIDDFSRATWLYLLNSKTEVFPIFKDFAKLISTQYNTQIRILRTDNGTEYINNNFRDFLSNMGIIHQTTCVGTPEQNGIAERKNRHILEVTRSLMFQSKIPKYLWSDAILTATYLINRLPSVVLEYKSPLETLNNQKISLNHLRIFGCTCFVYNQDIHRDKLDSRAIKCVFIGYSTKKKGYKCLDPNSNKIYISRNIKFIETQYFFENFVQGEQGTSHRSQRLNVEDIIGEFSISQSQKPPLTSTMPSEYAEAQSNIEEGEDEGRSQSPLSNEDSSPHTLIGAEDTDDANQTVSNEPMLLRRSVRQSKPSVKLQDFVTYCSSKYPIQNYLTYDNIAPKYKTFISMVSKEVEPQTFLEATKNPIWQKAMREELEALKK